MKMDLGYLDSRIANIPDANRRVLSLDWEIEERRPGRAWREFNSAPNVQIRFCRGLGDDASVIGTESAEQLGMHADIEAESQSDSARTEISLPQRLMERLQTAFKRDANADGPIFLRFLSRDGYLSMAHWEPAFEVALGMPVLRLPYYALPTRMLKRPRVALIFDDPDVYTLDETIRLIEPLQDAIYFYLRDKGSYPDSFVEVFLPYAQLTAGRSAYELLHPFEKLVNIHTWPDELSQADENRPDTIQRSVRHPLLRWISDTIGQDSIDYVIFVCRATVQRSRGALILRGGAPNKEGIADRLEFPAIESDELSTFLMQMGAWGSMLIAPQGSIQTQIGIRMLADEVMQSRPMPCDVVSHFRDWSRAWSWQSFLSQMNPDWPYYFLRPFYRRPYWLEYEHGSSPAPGLGEMDFSDGQKWLEEFTCLKTLMPFERDESERRPPRWQVAAQRILEAQTARLQDDSIRPTKSNDVQRGQERAIRLLASVIRQHIANTEGNPLSESQP